MGRNWRIAAAIALIAAHLIASIPVFKRSNPDVGSDFEENDSRIPPLSSAFEEVYELGSAVVDALKEADTAVFTKYFDKDDKDRVQKAFEIIIGNKDASTGKYQGASLLSHIMVEKTPGKDCDHPLLAAYLISGDTDWPFLRICPGCGWDHPSVAEIKKKGCDALGDRVSWRMESLASILLHEYTHYEDLMKPALGKGTEDHAYGPAEARALDKSLATNNADSLAWLANEIYWRKECPGKTFADPDPDDKDQYCVDTRN